MIYEVMRSINNCFDIPGAAVQGTWTIEDGSIDLDFLKDDQYFIIEGSIFNDGLHQYGDTEDEMTDEEFVGTIRPLAVPHAFLSLVEDIEAWDGKYSDSAMSPYNSESFAGYSYSKSSGNGSGNNSVDWGKAFSKQLRSWRRI